MTNEIRSLDAMISEDLRVVVVSCPQCGFHHEHDVTLPKHCRFGLEPTDLGLFESRCIDHPRIRYRILTTALLSADMRAKALRLDYERAKAVARREWQQERTRQKQYRAQLRDRARMASAQRSSARVEARFRAESVPVALTTT